MDQLAEVIEELGYTVNFWDLQIVDNVHDSINQIEEGILVWEQDIPFNNDEVNAVSSFLDMNGKMIVFGKSWHENEDFLAEHFGISYLRSVEVDYITNMDSQDNFLFSEAAAISEFSPVGESSTPLFSFNQGAGKAIIRNQHNFSGTSISAGFWLEELTDEDLPDMLEILLQDLSQSMLHAGFNDQSAFPNDSITIEFLLDNNDMITSLESFILIDPEYLSNFEIESTDRSLGMNWTIEDYPFGLILITAQIQEEAIFPGTGPAALFSADIYPNATGKISLNFMELTAQNNEENFSITTGNSQIDLQIDVPVLTMTSSQFINPGSSGQINLSLENEIPIYGFQICLTFEDSLLLFVDAVPTNRIPPDWWIGEFGEGSNAQIQLVGFGNQTIEPGTGPILNIEALAVDSVETITQIGYCDVFLLSENSQYIDYQAHGTQLNIVPPAISVSKYVVQGEEYSDILIKYNAQESFSGYQMDVSGITNGVEIHPFYNCETMYNMIEGNMYRITGFYADYGQQFPEMGTLIVISLLNDAMEEVNVEEESILFSNFEGLPLYCNADNTPHISTFDQDLNADNQTDILDLMTIKNFLNDELQIGIAQFDSGDINDDGSLDVIDMVILLQNLINSVTE